ncbi:MAG TPA: hypothetical protein VHC19_03785 [Pirellulales bacterium]|nr:hypothetical protein [Pirellulales bacterium]
MPDTPGKRPGDGRTIGVSEAEQKRRDEGKASPIQRQEAAGSAMHPAPQRSGPEESAGPTNPVTPPPESRTDWPRGVGEHGTEGVDPSQPLTDDPGRDPASRE